jgi:hypothetical protein
MKLGAEEVKRVYTAKLFELKTKSLSVRFLPVVGSSIGAKLNA